MTVLGLSLLLAGYFATMKESGGKVVPTYTQVCLESQYTFIKGLVGDQLGKDGYPYLPVIFTVLNTEVISLILITSSSLSLLLIEF